ncbi:hypothetical protein JCM8097_006697 [Rhodosporidiobolus ruineniae]
MSPAVRRDEDKENTPPPQQPGAPVDGDDTPDDAEQQKHADLAALLFPPSPPRPLPSPPRQLAPSSAQAAFSPRAQPRRVERESTVEISDSEAERDEPVAVEAERRRGKREETVELEDSQLGCEVRRREQSLTRSASPFPPPAAKSASSSSSNLGPTSKWRPPKPRSSTLVFDLSSSSDEDVKQKYALPAFSGRRQAGLGRRPLKEESHDEVVQETLVESLAGMAIAGGKTNSPTRRAPPPSLPPLAAPLPSSSFYLSTPSTSTTRTSTVPSSSSPPVATLASASRSHPQQRQKRRITISILSSSSSSGSSSSDSDTDFRPPGSRTSHATSGCDSDDSLPSPSRLFRGLATPKAAGTAKATPRWAASSSTAIKRGPAAPGGTGATAKGKEREKERRPIKAEVVEEEEVEEILAVCTDDDEPKLVGGTGVNEVDGVLIYDPTPRKRPVTLSRSASPLPSSPSSASTRIPAASRSTTPSVAGKTRRSQSKGTEKVREEGKSRLAREIDLTGSSSSEDELPPPRISSSTPRPRRRPPAASSSSTPAPTTRAKPPPATSKRASTTSSKPSKPILLTPSDRQSLPLALIRELDRSVFRRRWEGTRVVVGKGKGLPDGIEVVWNNRMRNTAGRASWKTTKHHSPSKGTIRTSHTASIELATKVTDTPEKLKHTLAHELCHLAAWAIDGEMKPPHGGAFKRWAARIHLVRPDIVVTTTHAYEIDYKYRWRCTSGVCGKIFGRHSNSINPSTHGCPCGARLVAIDKNGAVKGGATAPGDGGAAPTTPRKKSKWQEFMAIESPRLRTANPGLAQSEILKLVAERWKVVKAGVSAGGGENGLEESMGKMGL